MNSKFSIVVFIGILFLMSVSCSYLEHDASKRKTTHELFLKQKQLAVNREKQLFSVFDQDLSNVEKEALEFLYAYMPLSDLANYNQEFFLSQVKYALKTRTEFSWGASVPDDLFLHFVLPCRVNNEDMDSARTVFFHELKDRVKNLSMYDAALEVNHWCHEKVSYQPSDSRTSGPLNTVRTAFGRCGEESTFTVTAMRAVGIPARQIYTPRWAHSDDNHAWVEVWVNGKWHFLGACEPQPELNMGWFAEPATRAMLLHTRVFGNYTTSGEVVGRNEKYIELNVLPDYAPTKRLFVKVIDKENKAVENAKIEFQLYNYAEFYPLAKDNTNKDGLCSLLTGYGDLVVWASHNNQIAYQKVTVANIDTLKLLLGEFEEVIKDEEFDLVPPAVGKIAVATEEGVAENTRRLHQEDSIRAAYVNTFIDSLSIAKIAKETQIDNDKLQMIFEESRGNWNVIKEFVQKLSEPDKEKALALLTEIASKDRRDISYPVLIDHLNNSRPLPNNNELFYKYVLNPRISNELLTVYKKPIQNYFGEDFIAKTQNDVSVLLNWIKNSINVVSNEYTSRNPMSPIGLLELKVADKASRDIFTVAALRSFGLPSRLDETRGIPQLWKNSKWVDLSFETMNVDAKPIGKLELTWTPINSIEQKPKYYLQFTIAKFDGSTFRTLDYEYSNVFESFPAKIDVEEGQYMMVTGVREPNGTVWAKRTYFEVNEGQTTIVPIQFANPASPKNDIKTIVELNYPFQDFITKEKVILSQLNNNEGIVVIWIDPDKEPTKHLVNDLFRLKTNYNQWKGKIAIAIEPEKLTSGFQISAYKNLPDNAVFLIDSENVRTQFLQVSNSSQFKEYPMVFVLTKKGELVYSSSGYKIGIGDEILSKLNTHCLIH